MKRLALSLLAPPIALLCCACVATSESNPEDNLPTGENRPTVESRPPSSAPTVTATPRQETLAFGKSYTWHDGVTVTVGKPKKFQPSEYAAAEKAKRYLKFTVTVVNKSDKHINLGLTYVNVQSSNKEADQVFDSASGLYGPPDTKVLKGRTSEFDVGFGVDDTKDLVMEIALHGDFGRPSLRYST
jgi:hypothetical protein